MLTKKIYKQVIAHYGEKQQVQKCVEELYELIYELCKSDEMAEKESIELELADVLNMIEQIKLIYDIPENRLLAYQKMKMSRTLDKMRGEDIHVNTSVETTRG